MAHIFSLHFLFVVWISLSDSVFLHSIAISFDIPLFSTLMTTSISLILLLSPSRKKLNRFPGITCLTV